MRRNRKKTKAGRVEKTRAWQRVREAVSEYGSENAMAKAIGVRQPMLNQVIRLLQRPGLTAGCRIAEALDFPASWWNEPVEEREEPAA